MILGYSITMWLVFSFCLVYYTKIIFQHKYSFLKMFLLSIIFHLPYSIVSLIGTYISYFEADESMMLSILGLIAFVLLYFSRQVYMQLYMNSHLKNAFIFQMLLLLTGLIRNGFEDVFMYLASFGLNDYQLFVFSLIYKVISLILIYYFSNVLYQKMDLIFFDKKVVFLFFCEYLLLGVLGGFESILINIIVYIAVILVLYWIFKLIDQGYQLKTYQTTIDYQNQKIKLMMKEQIQRNEIFSKMRHDEKNHMLTLTLLYQQDSQKADDYLKQWQSDIKKKIDKSLCEEKNDRT